MHAYISIIPNRIVYARFLYESKTKDNLSYTECKIYSDIEY